MNKALNEKFHYDDSVTLVIHQPLGKLSDGYVKILEWKWAHSAVLDAFDCKRLSELFAEAGKLAQTPQEPQP